MNWYLILLDDPAPTGSIFIYDRYNHSLLFSIFFAAYHFEVSENQMKFKYWVKRVRKKGIFKHNLQIYLIYHLWGKKNNQNNKKQTNNINNL